MGPLSNVTDSAVSMTNAGKKGRHSKCQDRERCTGPGCRVYTGKTAKRWGN